MSTDHPESGYPPSTLFGRDAEIGQLRACLRAGKAGRGRLVLIGGEAGIGKTALVEEMAAMAEQDGMLVIRGACYDLATPPYGPWTEVLDDLALTSHTRQPPSLRPEGREGATPAAIRDAQTRLLEYLSTVADEQPLLIVLEDLHWSDPDSLSLTRYLSRALARRAVLVVVTYRDVELTADYPLQRYLPHLVRETRPLRISLQRFGREDIRAMSRARYALPDADEARLAAYLYDHAEGNPFFTEELLRSLAHDRRLACLGGRWRLGELHDAGVPLLVKQMIDARVAWMAPEARELLRIAAVIGADVPLALWRQVSGVSDEALALAVDHAREAQVVAAGPSNIGICFSHALVREAVYESVAPPQRQAWHRRIAELLAGEPVPGPDLVAFHFHQAGDPRAATWLVQAGTNALQSSAIEDAVERFQHALDLLPPDAAADRAIVLAHLADAHRYTHPDLALDYTDQARRLVTAIDDRAIATIVLWSRGRIRGFLGRASRDDLDEAIAAYRSLAPDDHTRIHAIGGRRGSGSGPFAQWLAHHGAYHDAIDVGLAATRPTPDGTSNDAGHAQFGLGLAYSGLGRSREGRSALEQARRQFTSAGNRFMASAALKWQLIESAYTWEADDLATRDALLRGYDDIWSLVGDHRADASGAFRSPLFPPLIVEGRWDDARAAAETYLSDTYLRVDCLAALGVLDRLQGHRDASWERVHQCLPDGPATEPGTPFFVRLLSVVLLAAELALDDGDIDAAAAWLATHRRWLEWSGRVLDRSAERVTSARFAELSGDLDLARERAAEALSLANEPRQPLAIAAALRAAGRVERLRGERAAATEYLARALLLAEAVRSPYEIAMTLLEQSELDIDRGPGDSAIAALDTAAGILESLDARPALARVSALRQPRPAAERRVEYPFGLSLREVEVLQLVARGLTDNEVADQLFISPRTVARHLQSIYNKLGVSSRTAATAIGFQHGVVSPAHARIDTRSGA